MGVEIVRRRHQVPANALAFLHGEGANGMLPWIKPLIEKYTNTETPPATNDGCGFGLGFPSDRATEEVLLRLPAVLFVDLRKATMSSRSTSMGEPSALALPRAVMIIGPIRPAFTSRISSVCEWYIQNTELPSIGPGPARSGTGHT